MNRCNLIIALFGVCLTMESCVGWSIWEDSIGVESVKNGNTLQLENGVNVVLLGLEDTRNGQERLQELLCPNDGETHQVWFIKDSSYPELFYLDEDNNTFYAYVSTADGLKAMRMPPIPAKRSIKVKLAASGMLALFCAVRYILIAELTASCSDMFFSRL